MLPLIFLYLSETFYDSLGIIDGDKLTRRLMEKQEKEFPIPFNFYGWTHGVAISKIRKDIDALEKLGATHVNIFKIYDWINIRAVTKRFETDQEYNDRLAKEKRTADAITAYELDVFNRNRK